MDTTLEFRDRSQIGLRRSLVLQASVLLLYLSAIDGIAQTHTVTNCTEAALRAAMAEGGTVSFACDGTIKLTSTVVITNDTILDASGHQITISGDGAVRVFEVCTNVQFSVENLTIADGLSTNGSGIYIAGGVVNATNCTFCGNLALGAASPPFSHIDGESGGGGAVANEGVLNLVNCTFTNNSAAGGAGSTDIDWFAAAGPVGGSGVGAAVWNSGFLLASGCTFAGNFAVGGTGGEGSSGDPMPWPTEGYPGGPGGDGAGGAIFNCGTASFVNCTLAFNTGTGGRGGFGGPGYQYSPDYPPVPDAPNGPSGLSVGGIYNTGTLMVDLCTFSANSGVGTNGLSGGHGNAGGSGSDAAGGAICNFGTLTINRSTFTNNAVFGGSGASGSVGFDAIPYKDIVWAAGNGGNGGSGGNAGGGALYNDGFARVSSSTFAYNSATGGDGGGGGRGGDGYAGTAGGNGGIGGAGGNGAGGAVCNAGNIQIVNSTFAYNSGSPAAGGAGGAGGSGNPDGSGGMAGSDGSGVGALYSQSSSCWITNCTFTGNSGGSGSDGSVGTGGIEASGGILVNTLLAANSPNNGSFTDGGHNFLTDADPMLGPLADNGGPTLTMALLPGSLAIDAGDTAAAPPTDQRGFRRPFGASADIGAYEYGFVTIATPPATQTAETGATTELCVEADEYPSQTYQWFFNDIALGDPTTNSCLQLSGLQASQGGAYTVVVSNIFGVVTSTPAMLNVIPVVERRPVPAINSTGESGTSLNVEYTDALGPLANWLPLDSVNLTNSPQFCFDVTAPLPPQRFYRAWQPGTPAVLPSLDLPFMVPAITLTGNIGDSLRLDYINAIGPTDAWVTLDTVTLTNASQLYFDTSSIGQPRRLYRIVPAP